MKVLSVHKVKGNRKLYLAAHQDHTGRYITGDYVTYRDIFEILRDDYDIDFKDFNEKVKYNDVLVGTINSIESDFAKSGEKNDVALLNRIIRAGSYTEYIEELVDRFKF